MAYLEVLTLRTKSLNIKDAKTRASGRTFSLASAQIKAGSTSPNVTHLPPDAVQMPLECPSQFMCWN